MAEWKLFPQTQERPAGIAQFKEKHRQELELIIATQIADLLSAYGEIVSVEVDNSDCIEVDEPQTFAGLSLPPITLDDDSQFLIEQFPIQNGEYCTEAGRHCITVTDEDDDPKFSFSVWDPEIDTDHRIQQENGEEVVLDTLQELYEALVISTYIISELGELNKVALETTEFPVKVTEADFEKLAESYYD